MADNLRDRIAAVLMRDAFGLTTQTAALRQADAVIRELTHAIPPIVATAIQGFVVAELAAISHHGEAGEYELLKRLNSEALQIALYATTHKDWND